MGVFTNSLVFPHVRGASQERAFSAVKSILSGSKLIWWVWSLAWGRTATKLGRHSVHAAHVHPRGPGIRIFFSNHAQIVNTAHQEPFHRWCSQSRASLVVQQLMAPVDLEVVKQLWCVHQLPTQPHVPNQQGICRHGQSISMTWVITATITRSTTRREGRLEICRSISMKMHKRSLSSSTDRKLSQELKRGGKHF